MIMHTSAAAFRSLVLLLTGIECRLNLKFSFGFCFSAEFSPTDKFSERTTKVITSKVVVFPAVESLCTPDVCSNTSELSTYYPQPTN